MPAAASTSLSWDGDVMLSTPVTVLALATAIASAVMSGAFFAFSSFVMQGLAAMPPAHGAAAMQRINEKAVTPAFMVALFGTALAALATAATGVANWSEPAGPWLAAGGALYLGGVFVMTAAYHVPRNNALAATDPATQAGRALWHEYLRDWTRWNHVRFASSLAAAAVLAIATRFG